MKKHIIVKQKHLYTNEKNIMYKGVARYTSDTSCRTLQYIEKTTNAEVRVEASDEELWIHRVGEVTSHLRLLPKNKSINTIVSEFGNIEIEVYTHKYIKKDDIIAVEYDIIQDEHVIDGYRIIWDIKEDTL